MGELQNAVGGRKGKPRRRGDPLMIDHGGTLPRSVANRGHLERARGAKREGSDKPVAVDP